MFARLGGGTLAPWDHTVHLVVTGPYRHVRNPMITGVFAVLLAESLLFHSTALLFWFGGCVIVNVVYIRASEEPRFGTDYDAYADNVPAWIPRPTAWHPPG